VRKHCYVYMLQCEGGSFYTGHAENVEKRFMQHMRGRGAAYTRMHKPQKIAYVEECVSRRASMKREREVKLLSHSRKQQLADSKPTFQPA
jgi:putative endonuclease